MLGRPARKEWNSSRRVRWWLCRCWEFKWDVLAPSIELCESHKRGPAATGAPSKCTDVTAKERAAHAS